MPFRIGLSLLEQMGVSFPREDFEPTMEQEMDLFYQEWKALGDREDIEPRSSRRPIGSRNRQIIVPLYADQPYSLTPGNPTGR